MKLTRPWHRQPGQDMGGASERRALRSPRLSEAVGPLGAGAMLCCTALQILPSAARAADEYVAVDVSRSAVAGPQPQVLASRPAANGINAWGDLVGSGWAGTNALGESATGKPYAFDRRAGTRTNLGNLNDDYGWGGDSGGTAHAVNDAGWVAGVSYSGDYDAATTFLWVDANTNGYRDGEEMIELDPNPGAGTGYAKAMNHAGHMLFTGNGLWRGQVTNDNGVVYEIGDRIQLSAVYASTYNLNEAGDACWGVGGSSPTYGYRWIDRNTNGEVDDGETAQLASPWGGDRSAATSINAHGQVCGYAKNLATTKSRGFLWTDLNTNDIAEASEFVELTTNYPVANIFAHSVNDHGQVVGGVAEGSDRFAFIWDAGQGLRDLNGLFSLSDPELGDFHASQAYAVNSAGQVGLYGSFGTNTSDYAVLLTPRPVISSASAANDTLTLAVERLTLSTTVVVERASSPVSEDWTGVDGFVADATQSVWTQQVTAGQGHYRVRMDNEDR